MPDGGSPWLERKTARFTLLMLFGADPADPINDDIDVEVVVAGEAERWGTTVHTLANPDSMRRKMGAVRRVWSGPFWADRMLIGRRLNADSDEFSSVMERLGENA